MANTLSEFWFTSQIGCFFIYSWSLKFVRVHIKLLLQIKFMQRNASVCINHANLNVDMRILFDSLYGKRCFLTFDVDMRIIIDFLYALLTLRDCLSRRRWLCQRCGWRGSGSFRWLCCWAPRLARPSRGSLQSPGKGQGWRTITRILEIKLTI